MFGIIKEEIKFLKVKVNLIIIAKYSSVCFVPQYLGDGLVDLCKLKARVTYITSIRSIMVMYKEIMSQKKTLKFIFNNNRINFIISIKKPN